ncbi:MAG TPA: alpha/beta family hydrolase, partial [Longimicrobiales bacterium]
MFLRPADARALYVFAHGAGAGMTHHFMQQLSEQLAGCGVATLRYQFPYTQRGDKRPDPPAVLEAAVRAAISAGHELAAGAKLIAGGKSMGGRMTSQALAKHPDPRVAGIAFVGFPL